MKILKITFRKEGHVTSCIIRYRTTDWPADIKWSGDHRAFVMPSGRLLPCIDTLESIGDTAAHQAGLCGATFEIEDLGGEATEWRDEVLFAEPAAARQLTIDNSPIDNS